MVDPRATAEKRVGQTLKGKWHVDRLLDVGGMAAVYAATHRNGKKVALKILHPQLASEPQIRERFLREGYVANKIEHQGAVQILDDDTTDDGAVFIVMELLEGESLDAYIRRVGGKLRVVEVLAIADQVLGVLEAAHAAQVVHRDIKPANLFISKEGHVKVLDFGLARVRDGKHGAQATAMGTILGTYQYMPPEQARGKMNMIDGRTDLWALGAVMFRALAGRYVFEGQSANQILLQAMKDRAPAIQTVAPTVPPSVAKVIDKVLAYEMDARFQTAGEMQNAVRETFEELRKDAAIERETMPSVTDEISVDIATASTLPSLVVEMSFGGGQAPPVEPGEDAPARSTKPSAVLAPKPPPRE